MDYTTIFTAIMSSITAIAVAILGVYQNKKAKENEEYKRLRDELEQERERKIVEKEEAEAAKLASIEQMIMDMQTEMSSLKSDLNEITNFTLKSINEQLSHMHTLQTDNFSYIQSLSGVVLTIGETLNDSSAINDTAKDKMAVSIKNHRETEIEIQKNLIKIIV